MFDAVSFATSPRDFQRKRNSFFVQFQLLSFVQSIHLTNNVFVNHK